MFELGLVEERRRRQVYRRVALDEQRPPAGVVNQVDPQQFAEGRAIGQWVVADSPDGAEILALDSPEFACLKLATAGFKKAIADAGAKWKITEEAQSPVTDVTTSAGPQRLAAMLRSHPKASYFWVMSVSWSSTLLQALQSVGRTDVTGVGTDADFFVPGNPLSGLLRAGKIYDVKLESPKDTGSSTGDWEFPTQLIITN